MGISVGHRTGHKGTAGGLGDPAEPTQSPSPVLGSDHTGSSPDF